jgi:hypothetical protein
LHFLLIGVAQELGGGSRFAGHDAAALEPQLARQGIVVFGPYRGGNRTGELAK